MGAQEAASAAAESSNKLPWLNLTPAVLGKVSVSIVLMSAGMFYLSTGRRDGSFNRMVIGAILALSCLLIW